MAELLRAGKDAERSCLNLFKVLSHNLLRKITEGLSVPVFVDEIRCWDLHEF